MALGLAMVAGISAPASAQCSCTKTMIDEVKERGVLRAGVKNDAPYLGFVDDKGELAGFEIDIVKDLARRLNVKVEFEPVKASNRVQLLQQGRIDIIVATVSHYRNRDRVVDFTLPYLYTPQTLLVKKASGIKSMADMAGKRFGLDAGSGAVKNVPRAQPKAIVQTFQNWPEAFFALERGTVDAVATDNLLLAGLRAASPDPSAYEVVGKEGFYGGAYYAAVGRGHRQPSSRWSARGLSRSERLRGRRQGRFLRRRLLCSRRAGERLEVARRDQLPSAGPVEGRHLDGDLRQMARQRLRSEDDARRLQRLQHSDLGRMIER
ncbi:MAG: transporter substrate-binding domain-containing protein [Hyphomicrobium sp.]|nr:transporter substrate-binding domain-containing protein [Hyphomicrobium sp.]